MSRLQARSSATPTQLAQRLRNEGTFQHWADVLQPARPSSRCQTNAKTLTARLAVAFFCACCLTELDCIHMPASRARPCARLPRKQHSTDVLHFADMVSVFFHESCAATGPGCWQHGLALQRASLLPGSFVLHVTFTQLRVHVHDLQRFLVAACADFPACLLSPNIPFCVINPRLSPTCLHPACTHLHRL